MSTSIRGQIVAAVCSALSAVPGVQFALAEPDPAYGAEDLPGILVLDTAAEITADGPIGTHQHDLGLEIVLLTAGITSRATVRELAAAIQAALGRGEATRWGGLAVWSRPLSIELASETQGDVIAAALLKITITYRTPLWGM